MTNINDLQSKISRLSDLSEHTSTRLWHVSLLLSETVPKVFFGCCGQSLEQLELFLMSSFCRKPQSAQWTSRCPKRFMGERPAPNCGNCDQQSRPIAYFILPRLVKTMTPRCPISKHSPSHKTYCHENQARAMCPAFLKNIEKN